MSNSGPATAPIVGNVLFEHVEQVSFLWRLRNFAVLGPSFNLADLAKVDQRLEAHLDGLRTAGDPSWQLCEQGLANGDLFASAILAFGSTDDGHIETVLAVDEELQSISALGWFDSLDAATYSSRLLRSPSTAVRRIGIAAAGAHRHNPGPPLLDALASPDIPLRATALRALGELGPDAYRREMDPYLTSDDANCRFWGAWAAVLLGDICTRRPWPLETLRALAEAGGIHYQQSADLAARRMPRADALAWHQSLVQTKQTRTAVRVAQGLADPELIPWLIELMRDPAHSKVAGEAFSLITGTDIAYLDLDLKQPPVPPNDEPPADATEPPDEDQDLPWPDPAIVAKWWSKYRGNFQPGVRYLLGKPIDYDSAMHALKLGYQRQRAAAALELVLLRPGPLFNIAAPGFRQMRQLGLTVKDFRRGQPDW